jgi:alpha-L-fucosidase
MDWNIFNRPTPEWYLDAKFGIFIHWGAYSVPAWAEPIGELGTIEGETWFAHNPYAEWYFNTIRIEGSPAWQHHQEIYGGAPYDDFLDSWKAEQFDAAAWAKLFRSVGAKYVIPVTKHHDGIALWDAPGTGTRNTVHRGPKRDLIGEIAAAVRAEGLKFGTYYSGGLDWSVTDLPPHTEFEANGGDRPNDAAYSMYAYEHCIDLIERYRPDILWDDINWPDFSKQGGPEVGYSLAALFDRYYKAVPEGLVNDRWGVPHHDYITSEYQMNVEHENRGLFENNRGIGYSFGYNQVETEEHHMSVEQAVSHLVDVVSRGGNFLLNVGPMANGQLPAIQVEILTGIASWMAVHADAIHGTRALGELSPIGTKDEGERPWVRFTGSQDRIFVFVKPHDGIEFDLPADLVRDDSAKLMGGGELELIRTGDRVRANWSGADNKLPAVIQFLKS